MAISPTTALTPTVFRDTFPEFADATKYPDAQIQFYIDLSALLLSEARWARLWNWGRALFVAHFMALYNIAMGQAAAGGTPGQQVGILNNKSVDKVSAGYDINAAILPEAGHWNLTIWGTQYLQLVRLVGMGPIQTGVGFTPVGQGFGPAWSGPWAFNFPNMQGPA